jgi:DeoR/GlpR family transcriptional regulator of sugar metabolism
MLSSDESTLALHLTRVPELTVVTNSLPVAEVFDVGGRPDQTVVLSGGARTPSDALVGPVAVRTIRSLRVDWAFMGVHATTPGGAWSGCPPSPRWTRRRC